MTSRVTSGQRLACLVAGFAILLLLGLLGVLWTARLGIFTNFGEKSPPSRRGVTSFPLTHSSTPVSSSTPKQNGDASNKKSEFEEFVKPIKTSPGSPNEHNLVFGNNIWARPEQPQETPTFRHHSGHFRHRMASIWDPHPQYEFTAFGHLFHLLLAHDSSSFVMPNIQVTHVWQNSTRIEQPGLRPDGCFYHGTVRGDPHSVVSVNLCHGMTGHIRTSSGSFFIEPAEKWLENHTDSVIHRLYRIPSPPFMQEQHQPEPHCGLDETIHVDSDEANEEGEMSDRRRRRKRSSQENIIEMMIVADRKMAEYHGSGLNAYVLTLMHTLSKIFKDASIGNPISVALVKLYVLKDVELAKVLPNEKRGILASTMLRNFCDWQRKVNDVNDGSPNHHDAAMLLTREDICRTEKNCDTLGLAELGTMCSDSSCAIVQDNGLSAAFTMAHELGHVLNMLHDDDQKCIPFQGMSNRNHVMARMLDHNTIPWSWSYCSRHFLTEYLDAGYGDCLHDEPVKDIMTERGTRTTFPGENYTEDEQCALVFGRGSKICPYMSHCKRLWCTSNVESEGCRTQHMPWADGTPCGENHFKGWCQRGDCVPVQALDPIDGNWGEWQGWGPCSRSCGGGVKKSKRDCDDPSPSNGGKYCVGERERFRSCNTKDCPLNSQDFREEQCAQFNYNNFSIHGLTKDVQWIPKYSGIGSDDRCKLYCQVAHSTSYYLLRDKVVDGTPCEPDTFDICVNGVCIPSGCDHRLRSTTQLDYCGQCGGNNSSCQLVSGSYNSSQHGYSQVLRIPAGSSNLDIRQKGWNNSNKDDNYLALKDGETGGYILNGNYVVSMFRKLILYGSTTLEYSGSDADVERINSSRPLTKDLIIEVLSVGPLYPPDISYQYTIQYSSLAQYAWQISDDWSACNKVCNGERRKVIKCVRVEGRQEVAVEHCNGLNAPYTPVQSCNKHCDLKSVNLFLFFCFFVSLLVVLSVFVCLFYFIYSAKHLAHAKRDDGSILMCHSSTSRLMNNDPAII